MTVRVLAVTENLLFRLQKVARETFYETFIHETTEENMQAYLAEVFGIDRLKKQLENLEETLFLIQCCDEDAGYLKLNIGFAQTEMRESSGIEIERLYIRKPFHGKGAATALMEEAINVGRQLNKSYIWLGVAESNVKAVRFYRKFGFEVFGEHTFTLGNELQTDLMMKKSLSE